MFDGGTDGVRRVLRLMRRLTVRLAGGTADDVSLSEKMDGSMAVFFGADPDGGGFLVAKKGIFNRNPEIYRTAADVRRHARARSLRRNLNMLLRMLRGVAPDNGIWQGDLLYVNGPADRMILRLGRMLGWPRLSGYRAGRLYRDFVGDGEYLLFHANTLTYAVPYDGEIARAMRKSAVGLFVHTAYAGDNLRDMTAVYGPDLSGFTARRSVWLGDPSCGDVTPLDARLHDRITSMLADASSELDGMPDGILDGLADDRTLNGLLARYWNGVVRRRERPDADAAAVGFREYAIEWFDGRTASLSMQAWIDRNISRRDDFLQRYAPHMRHVFVLHGMITDIKLALMGHLNRGGRFRVLMRSADGAYRDVPPEGWVVAERNGGAFKMVDRVLFSADNAAYDALKGWRNDVTLGDRLIGCGSGICNGISRRVAGFCRRMGTRMGLCRIIWNGHRWVIIYTAAVMALYLSAVIWGIV